jgi:hypothetical protein
LHVDKSRNHCYPYHNNNIGKEWDKYLWPGNRELRVGATQQQAKEKSTQEPTR